MRTLCAVLFASVTAVARVSSVAAEESERPVPIRAATSIRLIERGAILADDFAAPRLDAARWRIWQQNAEQTTVEQKDGRLAITAQGPVSMNGLWGLVTAKYKDVSLVAEMDIRSQGPRPHRLALHLCGGDGRRSPDHWVELLMVDLGDTARFFSGAALPEAVAKHEDQSLELPHTPNQGFLCRVDLNGTTNLAELWVQTTEGWKRVCDPIELSLRTIHTEVKIHGNLWGRAGEQGEPTSTAWFDNVRIYPRAPSHHVGVQLVRPDGSPIWIRDQDRWPPVIRDSAGKTRKISDLKLELRTEDGLQLVAAQQSQNFGFYLFPLQDSPWEVFPVAAQVRVLLDDQLLGNPIQIKCQDCEGLYPDDVYEIVIE
jgi:hypothetical protein